MGFFFVHMKSWSRFLFHNEEGIRPRPYRVGNPAGFPHSVLDFSPRLPLIGQTAGSVVDENCFNPVERARKYSVAGRAALYENIADPYSPEVRPGWGGKTREIGIG